MSVYSVLILVLSTLRKRAYIPLLVALTPPVILSVALLSIPSTSSALDILSLADQPTILVSKEPITNECFRARIFSTYLGFEEVLPTIALIVDQTGYKRISGAISSKSTIDLEVEDGIVVSLPERLYQRLGRPSTIYLRYRVENFEEYRVVYVHKLLNALIIIVDELMDEEPNTYLCLSNTRFILRNSLAKIENTILSHALIWVLSVTILHTFMLYVAIMMLARKLQPELRSLLFTGIDPSSLTAYACITVLIISATITLLLYSLTVVVLNTSYYLASTFTPVLSPELRPVSMVPVLLILTVCSILSYISFMRVIRHEV